MARALAMVAAERPIDLTVVGMGLLRSSIEEILGHALGSVRFRDQLSQQELADEYRAAHVLIHTSSGEGWSQTVLEAMATGLPVVASDVPGIRDVLAETGLLVRAGDARGFAAALRKLASDFSLRKTMRREALNRSRHFTWDRVADKIDKIYADLVVPVSGALPR